MTETIPTKLVRDSAGHWHAMVPIANRFRALCEYLNLDEADVERGSWPNCEVSHHDDVTCPHCFLLFPHAEDPKP